MSTERTEVYPFVDHGELSAVLADYLAAVDRGETPDRDELLVRHPLLADRLRAFFSDEDRLTGLTGPLRPDEQPETLGGYELVEEIGRGGMGAVLRGRDRVLDRELAVKVLLRRYAGHPELVRRFVEEARITGQLQHPFIVPVHDLGTMPDGRPFFAMKLVKGRTLAALLAERPDPTHERALFLKVFEQVAQTIAYAHSRDVIHRDLKPGNVMVGAFGEVQVMDWGLAKCLHRAEDGVRNEETVGLAGLADSDDESERQDVPALSTARPHSVDRTPPSTSAGAVLGTPSYMPPEQANGDVKLIDRRSDVFGLGAILCEILTGQPPYVGEVFEIREQAHDGDTTAARRRLDVCGADVELIELAKRCLAENRDARPADGGAVADAMAAYFAAVQERLRAAEIARATAETKAIAEEQRAKYERRRRRATLLTAVSLLLLVASGATFALWFQQQEATRAAAAAARRAATERDVTSALNEAKLLHQEGLAQTDYPERWQRTLATARSALKHADEALVLGESTAALREQVEAVRTLLDQDEHDCRLFAELDRIMLESSTMSSEDVRRRRPEDLYAAAFKKYGLDLTTLDVSEAAARLRRHPHGERLLDEIEFWVQSQAADHSDKGPRTVQKGFRGVKIGKADWSKADRLVRILDAAEADPASFRSRWHTARLGNDRDKLIELTRSPQARELSAVGASALASDLIFLHAIDEARVFLKEARGRQPSSFWLNYWLAVVTAASNPRATDEAIGYFQAALALRTHNAAAVYMFLSTALRARGDQAGALEAARKAVESDPDSAPAHHGLGMIQWDQNDLDAAYASFRRAADLDEVNPYPLDALGQICAARKQWDEAIVFHRKAIERDQRFAGAYVNLAAALVPKNDRDGAIEAYEQALKQFPEYGLAHMGLAFMLRLKNDIPGAIEHYKAAIDGDPDLIDAYNQLAGLYLSKGDGINARRTYMIPVEKDPKSAKAQILSSAMLLVAGDTPTALRCAEAAVELEPKSADAHTALVRAILKKGDTNEAIRRAEGALVLCPDSMELHDTVGSAYYWKCDFDRSVRNHRKALERNPSSGVSYENIGLALRAKGDLDGAADAFRSAIRLTKTGGEGHQLLAETLLAMHQQDPAIEMARKAIERNATNLTAYLLLASALMEKGEFTKAMEELKRGQALLSPFDPRQSSISQLLGVLQQFETSNRQLPAIVSGEEKKPPTPAEKFALGFVCARYHRERHAAAGVRFFTEAFTADPRWADHRALASRFHAAVCASLAATGKSADAADLDDTARAALRRQVRDWLRADLAQWEKINVQRNPVVCAQLQFSLRDWQTDPALAGLRDPEALMGLPTEERMEWLALWDSLAALQKKAAE